MKIIFLLISIILLKANLAKLDCPANQFILNNTCVNYCPESYCQFFF